MYRSLVQCDINFGQTKEEEMKLIDKRRRDETNRLYQQISG